MRRVLLDTHVFVWALSSPAKLDSRTRALLDDPQVQLELSVASAWELAIKSSLGKISIPGGVRRFVADGCSAGGVTLLGIDLGHLDEVERLPLHHRDPFDRLMIAQARAESIELLTFDPAFLEYDVALAIEL